MGKVKLSFYRGKVKVPGVAIQIGSKPNLSKKQKRSYSFYDSWDDLCT